jgi:uncharacterized protein (TIGR03437 family)
MAGYSGDGGQATNAAIGTPQGLALDAAGNLFIVAASNGPNVIRKVTPNGVISTVAGNGTAGYSGDGGPATSAALNTPRGLAIDTAGNLFIVDQGNNRIRKVSNGIISTVAGNGQAGYAGDSGPAISAELSLPQNLSLDAAGNLYITDDGNSRIRALLTDGTIVTVAGNGVDAFAGEGGPASSASLSGPWGLARSSSGTLYVSGGNRVRSLTPVIEMPAMSPGSISSASAFGGFTSIAPGSWIEIYGSNLASDARSWNASDFNGVNAPTSLDGTSVSIGGQSAFLDYISSGQVNALVPSNVSLGSQQIIITSTQGPSTPLNVTVNAVQPGLLAPSTFRVGTIQYAVAILPDGSYALPTGAIPGVTSRPAKPEETVILYGVGFGPVIPNIPAGQLVGQSNTLAANFQMCIGGLPATALYSGLAPDFTGLYQFNIVVPDAAANSFSPLTFTLGGTTGTQTLYIAVQN